MAYRPPWKKQPAQQAELAPQQRTERPDPVIQQAAQSSSAPRQEAAQTNPAPRQEVAQPAPAPNPGAAQPVSLTKAEVNRLRKITGSKNKTKAIDFNSQLVPAKSEDFSMIHGCGGKDHAGNSTIGVVICDYSKGKGKNAVTVKANIDALAIDGIYLAAIQMQNKAWELLHHNNPMRPAPGETPYKYTPAGKVNPYVTDNDGLSPVSQIAIKYCPVRTDGAIATHPWYIGISNCYAPVQKRQNGAITYDGKAAVKKKTAYVNMSYEDFANAMTAVEHHIRSWEMNCNKEQFIEGYRMLSGKVKEKENE